METAVSVLKHFNTKSILFIFLALFILFEVATINFNTAFTDEAQYLIIGKFLWDIYQTNDDPSSYIFGNVLFPLIYGNAENIGGFFAARVVGIIVGAMTAFCFFFIAKEYLGKRKALVAMILFMINAPFLFASKIVSLEMFSLFFMVVAFYFVIAGKGRNSKLFYISPVIFFLSVISKYTAIIFVIFFIVLIYLQDKKKCIYFISIFSALTASYVFIYYSSLKALYTFYTNNHFALYNQLEITRFFLIIIYFSLPFALAFISRNDTKQWKLLMGGSLLIFLFHIFTLSFEYTILKHIIYPFVFLSPLMADGLFKIRRKIAYLCVIVFVLSSAVFLYALEYSYPNITEPLNYIDEISDKNTVLLGESTAYIYYGIGNTKQSHTTFYFDYDGDALSTKKDFEEAIDDGFFDIIVLDSYFTPDLSGKIKDMMSGGYYLDKTFESWMHFGNRVNIELYRKIGSAVD